MKKFFIIILSLFVLSCSSDSGSGGDDPGGNNGGNSGGNNGGNNGGGNNTDDGSTDPDDYTNSTSEGNTTYYVSFSSGDDANDGKTETTPFKNLGKINSITFKAGDIVKFKKGDTWKGYFKIRGSGSEDSHISVDSYGSGNLPIIDGNGYQAGIFLENIENITISILKLQMRLLTESQMDLLSLCIVLTEMVRMKGMVFLYSDLGTAEISLI